MANNYGDYNRRYLFNYSESAPHFTKNATEEYPSHQITVRIRLNPSGITNDMKDRISSKLRPKNMTLTPSGSSRDIIIVSGIPPDNHFDRNKILEIVQEYNCGAQFAN